MIVGTVRELKVEEHRVGLTPSSARDLTLADHKVLVESTAGEGGWLLLAPPLTLNREDVDAIVHIPDATLKDLEEELTVQS